MINPHRPEYVVITRIEHDKLKKSRHMLRCLEAGGVDNWEWYSESLQPHYRKYYPEDYDDARQE
jgi:hypothetical protein